MPKFQIFICVLFGLGFSACTKVSVPNPIPFENHSLEAGEGHADRTIELRQSEFNRDRAALISSEVSTSPRPYDVQKYELKARFDWARRALLGSVTVTLNLSSQTDVIELDSKVFSVNRVRSSQEGDLPFQLISDRLQIDISSLRLSARSALRLIIDYEARSTQDESGLSAIADRPGDPVRSRVVFSHSEPILASTWMPCNDRPSDRAIFATDFEMPSGESLISNGAARFDQMTSSGERRMGYETQYSIPTYLMAFALGEFSHSTVYHGVLPVSIWARRGLSVDFQGLLGETVRQISTIEGLLVPYPFEKYAIVLLPDFPAGGMENAGITFNAEERSSQSLVTSDLSLMGHELGHQWFGDLMTVKDWDDVWIKEGMATLLAAELSRPYEDSSGVGRLFGDAFFPEEGMAIRDRDLPPESKYTSGPYARSAWLFTQVRSVIGESAFWGTLRQVLRTHAFGNISTQDMIEAFRPALGPELTQKFVSAIDAKVLPHLKVRREIRDGAPVFLFQLSDAEGSLLEPLVLDRHVSMSEIRREILRPGLELVLPAEGLFVPDPTDSQPLWTSFLRTEDYQIFARDFLPSFVPSSSWQMDLFLTLPTSHQSIALSSYETWALTPSQFQLLQSTLGSGRAKILAVLAGCVSALRASRELPSDLVLQQNWQRLLTERILNPFVPKLYTSSVPMMRPCLGAVSAEMTLPHLSLLKNDPSNPQLDELAIHRSSFIPLPSEEVPATWTPVALRGRSMRSQITAINTMSSVFNSLEYNSLSSAEKLSWSASFRSILAGTRSWRALQPVVSILVRLKDESALPILKETIGDVNFRISARRSLLCSAYKIAANPASEVTRVWDGFRSTLPRSLQGSVALRQVLANPRAECL